MNKSLPNRPRTCYPGWYGQARRSRPMTAPRPAFDPPAADDSVSLSHVSISFTGGGVTVWSDPGTTRTGQTAAETLLALRPERPVVIGRQQGGEVPYLDPHYVPTHVLPES